MNSISRLTQELQYFLVLCEELSYTRAAQRLNIAQPTLTKHINQLEQSLHSELLERSDRRRLSLTPAGQAFLPHAHRIVAELRDAQTSTREASSPRSCRRSGSRPSRYSADPDPAAAHST